MIIIKREMNTDILAMNEQWIEASHYHAGRYRRSFFSLTRKGEHLPTYEYLDVMGMYETGWMVYDFDTYDEYERNKYGYPGR